MRMYVSVTDSCRKAGTVVDPRAAHFPGSRPSIHPETLARVQGLGFLANL